MTQTLTTKLAAAERTERTFVMRAMEAPTASEIRRHLRERTTVEVRYLCDTGGSEVTKVRTHQRWDGKGGWVGVLQVWSPYLWSWVDVNPARVEISFCEMVETPCAEPADNSLKPLDPCPVCGCLLVPVTDRIGTMLECQNPATFGCFFVVKYASMGGQAQ
jgi:hypothetical protein